MWLALQAHPEFPHQNLSRGDQLALARQGAFLERCVTTPFTGKYDWSWLAGNISVTGPSVRSWPLTSGSRTIPRWSSAWP